MLQRRIPSLINSPGIPIIDGVPTAAPHFNENKPARNEPSITNTAVGAIEIQKARSRRNGVAVWPYAGRLGSPSSPASAARSSSEVSHVSVCGIRSDCNCPGDGSDPARRRSSDSAIRYRHDLAFAEDPTIPKNPHTVLSAVMHPNALYRSIARGLLDQVGTFFASGGSVVITPEPARFFEVPIRTPLPEALNFIP